MTELLAYFNGKITISDKIKEKLNEIIIEKKLVKGEKILLDNSIKKEHIFVTNAVEMHIIAAFLAMGRRLAL